MGLRYAVLDSGPLGLACSNPAKDTVKALQFRIKILWPERGIVVILPEIADYEIRRELIRGGDRSKDSLRRLDSLPNLLGIKYIHIRSGAMRLAAGYWARCRETGLPTASDFALDADVILAAQAADMVGFGDEVTIITDNSRHLSRLGTTSTWQSYTP